MQSSLTIRRIRRRRAPRALAAVLLVLCGLSAAHAARFVRGDCNSDGQTDISDSIAMLLYNFGDLAEPSCLDACDADDDGVATGGVTDAVFLLQRLFRSGPPPPSPYPDCGSDPTSDLLGCDGPTPCGEAPTVSLTRTSPTPGETGVAVTRETVLEFDGALAAPIDPSAVRALFSTGELAHRLHVSPGRDRLTLFYAEPLPASARIHVELDGTRLLSGDGEPVDLDGDGQTGDLLVLEFDTLSTTTFPGTHVCGRVFASELQSSPEGVVDVNAPLAGVRITVDGLEDELFTVTDALGNFRLEDAPAGRFFVHIDGRTATNPIPEGAYYPFVGKAWQSAPGVETNVGEIYLPLVDSGTLAAVSEMEETIIGFPDSVLEEFPEFADVTISVPADSLYSDDGTRGGMVGIAPVSPDRLPGQLPPGLNFPLVITVQTNGPTNFDRPVPVCFPNLPDPVTGEVLPPGAKSALWSFNHDTGRFEVAGSMTVSADGRLVCSDAGVGIRAPGWHGVAPGATGPGDCNDPTCVLENELEPPCDSCDCPRPPAQPTPQPAPLPGHLGARDLTDPVYLHNGEFYLVEEDLRIPGRGFDFIWSRKYRSLVGPVTAQGNRWDFSYNVSVVKRGSVLRVRDGNAREDGFFPLEPDGPDFDRAGFFHEIHAGDGPWTITFPDGGFWEFPEGGGKIQRSVDRNGNQMTFHYDGEERLVRITDTLDRDIVIAHDARGRIETVTDFAGRTLRYEYYSGEPGGSPGDLKSVTSPKVLGTPNDNDFPDGKTTMYTYDGASRLLTVTDGRRIDPNDPTFGEGPFLINSYSGDRVVRQEWGGDVVDLSYKPLDGTPENDFVEMITTVNDRRGNVKEFSYHRGHVLKSVREYTGRADARAPTTETENRPRNRLRPDDPPFFVTRMEYNDDSLPERIDLPNGNRVVFAYESGSQRRRANLILKRRFPGGHSPPGGQASIEQRFEYGEEQGGCCGFGLAFATRYVDGRGNTTRHEYDERGNRVRTIHRIASVVEDFEYNEFGQMTARVWPRNGLGHRRRDEYDYHDAGPQRGYLRQLVIDADNLALTYTFEYDAVGNLVRLVDPRGDETLYIVNQRNQIVRMTSPEVDPGSGLRYDYDFGYDANDNLIRIDVRNVDDDGSLLPNARLTTTLEYEMLNRLARKIEEVDESSSIVTEYEYDANRNLLAVRYGEATGGNQPENVVRLEWDERDLLLRRIRAPGHSSQSTSRYDYDRNENLVRIVQGLEGEPRVTRRVFDGYDRLVESTDPMGNVTGYAHDANSNVFAIAVLGELDDVEGDGGNVRLYFESRLHDTLDRVTRKQVEFFDTRTQDAIDDGNSTTTYEYSDNSLLVSATNDNGHGVRFFHDSVNRLMEVVDPAGNSRTFTYDADSNLVELREVDRSGLGRDPQVFLTTFEYDGLERLISRRDNAGSTTRFGYDSRSNVTSIVDPLGNVVRRRFDGLSRLVETTRELTETGAGGGAVVGEITTLQSWDDSSRLVERTDDSGNTCTYVYDPLNRVVAIAYADGTSASYEHDVHDNVVAVTDANGSVTLSEYDLLERLVRSDIQPGEGVSSDTTFEVFGYDGLSRLVRAEDDDAIVTWAYDSLSSVVEETLQGQSTRATHDGVGNMLTCTYPGGRGIICTYDELERKRSVSDAGGAIADWSYVGPYRTERRDLGNGTRTDLVHDGFLGTPNPPGDFGVQQVIRSTHTLVATGDVIDDRIYRWDRRENKTRRDDLRAGVELVESFDYDSVYRLLGSEAIRAGQADETIAYSYDGVGNRNSVTGGPDAGSYSMSSTLPEPADHQCNQYTLTPFDTRLHDANGNLIAIDDGLVGERIFVYDFADRLVGFADAASGTQASYRYDALGRRIERVVDAGESSATRYFYSGWHVVEEQDDAGETEASYVHGRGLDEVVQMERDGAELYFHADDLGSVTALTDAAGAVVERYEYADFGEPLVLDPVGLPRASSVAGSPYLFTGRRHDPETGWYYYRTRYHDPRAGRFTSRDRIGVWGDGANLGNAYTYVANNPMSLTDPMGLDPVDPFGKTLVDAHGPTKPVIRPLGLATTQIDARTNPFAPTQPQLVPKGPRGSPLGLLDDGVVRSLGPDSNLQRGFVATRHGKYLNNIVSGDIGGGMKLSWEYPRARPLAPAQCTTEIGSLARAIAQGQARGVSAAAARSVATMLTPLARAFPYMATSLGIALAGTAKTEGEALLYSLPFLLPATASLPLGLAASSAFGRMTQVEHHLEAADGDFNDMVGYGFSNWGF